MGIHGLLSTEFQVDKMKCLKMDSSDDSPNLWMYLIPLSVHLTMGKMVNFNVMCVLTQLNKLEEKSKILLYSKRHHQESEKIVHGMRENIF